MKLIGMLTIGQTPRNDILSSIESVLDKDIKVIEAGALDDFTTNQIQDYEKHPDDYILVTKIKNGKEVKLPKRILIPLLQKKIHELNAVGVNVIVIMCTGKFPPFISNCPVVTPSEILHGVIEGVLKKGRLGVIYPTHEQVTFLESEFSREGISLYGDWYSPYLNDGSLNSLIQRLLKENLELVFLNCFGFDKELKDIIYKNLGIPVIQANTLIARILNELV
ncbi:AroM family protein [Candidatus Bathyarchaeota archaeon]|nr:AroM family protein [Candidatus Bathyarchaeota archaeon]